MGALNVYADWPHPFDEDAEDIGYVLAADTAPAWDSSRKRSNFGSVLASRDLVGQAIGNLMSCFDIDVVEAFELLKRLSQVQHRETARHRP